MWLRVLIAAGAGALVAAPVAQAAPVLRQPLKPCYVSAQPTDRQPVTVDAGGFDPFARVAVALDGAPAATWFANATGGLRRQLAAPWVATGERPFSLQLTESAAPASALALTSKVTALSVTLTPARARPSRRVRFAGRGFTAARPVFAHYVFGGRLRKTVRLTRPHGDCGTFSARARQIPIRHPRTGQWIVDFDQRRRYAGTLPPVRDRLLITVRRIPRSH
jgi:hypothetical protein